MTTKIEWASHSWNPIIGCSPASEGCSNCYAAKFATRHAGNPKTPNYHAIQNEEIAIGGQWTGATRLLPEKLSEPLSWRKPRARVFVGSMTDLFHESTSFEDIAAVFGVMATESIHTFLLLTKRPERMAEWFRWAARDGDQHYGWPLSNVWLGVSAENQARADERIPTLLDTPAAKRFVSVEPMLGPVDLYGARFRQADGSLTGAVTGWPGCGLDWCIVGAEAGQARRPMDLDWARSVRDQCAAAGVPYFFKKDSDGSRELDGVRHEEVP